MTISPRNTAADHPMLNLLAAMDAQHRTGDSSNMILEQEAAGQRQLVNSDVLPTKYNGRGESDIKEALTKIGFVFGDVVNGDPMFQTVQLPEGWKREGSGHAMWSYVHDQHGRERLSIFYKAAFYDRDAFFNVTPAIQVSADEEDTAEGKKMVFHVKKCDEIVFSTKEVEAVGDVHSVYDVRDGERAKAWAWAKENYPDHENPCAYWD